MPASTTTQNLFGVIVQKGEWRMMVYFCCLLMALQQMMDYERNMHQESKIERMCCAMHRHMMVIRQNAALRPCLCQDVSERLWN